jgi:hypothetical protein
LDFLGGHGLLEGVVGCEGAAATGRKRVGRCEGIV